VQDHDKSVHWRERRVKRVRRKRRGEEERRGEERRGEERIAFVLRLVRYDRIDPEQATLITIRRSNMVEDSFAKLWRLKGKLKGNIKIEFVNEEGLSVCTRKGRKEERKGKERKGKERKGREGKEGKGREGKGREGKVREGKGRQARIERRFSYGLLFRK
jgi:hypothetical protein